MAGACGLDAWRGEGCRDSAGAMQLKLISIGVIFVTSVVGISSPVVLARVFQGKPMYDKAVLVIKCFAAGVILSTSLVHVLPDAFQALSDCQVASRHPWRDFPFTGLFTLVGSLLALFVDVTATSHVNVAHCTTTTGNNNHKSSSSSSSAAAAPYIRLGTTIASSPPKKKKSGDYELGSATIGRQEEGYGGTGPVQEDDDEGHGEVAATAEKMKQRLVSQVLEIGIIFHSVIIGVTMGMSQNRCTIKPLVAALAFHQIFEGMGLGGCIAQAGFKFGTTVYMCVMFSVTTPLGILLGMMVFAVTGYDDNSPGALISEGILGSLSSGVLIYMALVDLIAADFFHNKMMDSTQRLKKVSFVALTLGSASMSILALWA